MANCILNVKNRIWITGEHGNFLGEGRIELLENIRKAGSISKAAKSMKMSYKKAWEMVDTMNKEAKKPLVTTEVGGKEGGGAKLTGSGELAILIFNELQDKGRQYLKLELQKILIENPDFN